VARTNGFATGLTEPFDRDQEPKGLDVGPEFTKAAFGLSADDPFAGPISGQDGAYVIALQTRLPYQIPTLDNIRDRVESDYRLLQAHTRAQEESRNFYQTLTNGLAQAKAFTNICAEAKVKPVELPPFSISTRSLPELEELVSLDQLKQAAFSTQPGKASLPQRTADGSMVLFVKAKLPLDPAKMQTDLPAYVNAVRRSRQQEAFDAWFRREAEKGLRDTPLGRPQPPQLGSAAKS
jgi:parvulin-like peptidyl-prolyl isomerase